MQPLDLLANRIDYLIEGAETGCCFCPVDVLKYGCRFGTDQ